MLDKEEEEEEEDKVFEGIANRETEKGDWNCEPERRVD